MYGIRSAGNNSGTRRGRTLGSILLDLGFCTQTDIAAALAAQYGVETGRAGGAKADAWED